MENQQNPLVSIIVITYNSSKYVLETLESAKAQTYQNIELIISDDASSDDTINICKDWLEKNKESFVRTELVTVEKNTGTSANCNRGLNNANGKWLKLIAGDDILFPNCIKLNVEFSIINKEAKFIFSKYRYLIGNEISPKYYFRKKFFEKSNKEQYNLLLEEVGVNAATSFISIEDLRRIGGYDSSFPFLEDAPLWLRASLNGYKLYAFDSFTVMYRIHSNNSSLSNDFKFINLNYYYSKKKFFNDKIKKELLKKKKYITLFSYYVDFYVKDIVIKKGNRKSDFNYYLKFINLFNINKTLGFNGFFNKHKDYNI